MPESANAPQYDPSQARGLSAIQRALLHRASGEIRWIVLDKHEIPAASGLVRRGLAGWDRPKRGSFWNRRPVPGTRRTFWLTETGRTVAKHVAPPRKPTTPPLTLERLSELASELAHAVLRETREHCGDRPNLGPSSYVANRARALLERLDDEEVRRG